jgi:predicted dehydrogenase
MARRTRREFLQASALAGVGFWVVGTEAAQRRPGPNERLNVAFIGAGGRAAGNLWRDADAVSKTDNIVALCDVDENRAREAFKRFDSVPKYQDFRVMLDKQKDIDAVVVSTPDHQHAVAAAMAIRLGKHVYCEKPLTHDVWEARELRLLAAKHKVATQMGNQGTARDGLRTGVEVIRSGAIGEIRVVHVWTNRPIWPQNIAQRPKEEPPPKGLNWDLWLGTAPYRPYGRFKNEKGQLVSYAPFNWRGWWDFGTGAIGDMACHTMNLPFMALNLGAPTTVVADLATKLNSETAPEGCTVTYEFPARPNLPPGRGTLPACRLFWYERRRPPEELFQGQKPARSGILMIGSKGTLYSANDNGTTYLLLPEANFKGYKPPTPTLPRSPGHHAEWIRACKGGPPAMSNFDYAGPLTETALLGNVAMRAGQRLQWDAAELRAVGCPEADHYIRRQYRKGWSL